ncbi:hypothetical protein AMELA_G00249590 [Ameiurus melas]|uniref:Uncharacterized protein n=1 Tax=Ameiurus melas TaxID=219545 RepID=A0A7J5ZUB4_AMEME|nr:hypothetical protein AMELA_G00249590 [Ameiurus melas]
MHRPTTERSVRSAREKFTLGFAFRSNTIQFVHQKCWEFEILGIEGIVRCRSSSFSKTGGFQLTQARDRGTLLTVPILNTQEISLYHESCTMWGHPQQQHVTSN